MNDLVQLPSRECEHIPGLPHEWELIHGCGARITTCCMRTLLQLVAEHYLTCAGAGTTAAPAHPRPDGPTGAPLDS